MVKPPTWRHDLLTRGRTSSKRSRRLDRLRRIARCRAAVPARQAPDHPLHVASRRVREACVAAGLAETRPMPFIAEGATNRRACATRLQTTSRICVVHCSRRWRRVPSTTCRACRATSACSRSERVHSVRRAAAARGSARCRAGDGRGASAAFHGARAAVILAMGREGVGRGTRGRGVSGFGDFARSRRRHHPVGSVCGRRRKSSGIGAAPGARSAGLGERGIRYRAFPRRHAVGRRGERRTTRTWTECRRGARQLCLVGCALQAAANVSCGHLRSGVARAHESHGGRGRERAAQRCRRDARTSRTV